MPARAVVVSTHSFANCGFPDTGQTVCYSTTTLSPTIPVAVLPCPVSPAYLAGQDGVYTPGAAQPSYTLHQVSGSFVTVDNRTGLMWVTNPTDAGLGGTYDWAGAIAACESETYAGYTDWRLPNARELESIVDYSKTAAPAINASYFQGTPVDISIYYWTSTTYAQDTTVAWVADFADGLVYHDDKANANYARCVRAGP